MRRALAILLALCLPLGASADELGQPEILVQSDHVVALPFSGAGQLGLGFLPRQDAVRLYCGVGVATGADAWECLARGPEGGVSDLAPVTVANATTCGTTEGLGGSTVWGPVTDACAPYIAAADAAALGLHDLWDRDHTVTVSASVPSGGYFMPYLLSVGTASNVGGFGARVSSSGVTCEYGAGSGRQQVAVSAVGFDAWQVATCVRSDNAYSARSNGAEAQQAITMGGISPPDPPAGNVTFGRWTSNGAESLASLGAVVVWDAVLPPRPDHTPVYIIAGQSNAGGIGDYADLTPAQQQAPTNVSYTANAGTLPWGEVRPDRDGHIGPEFGLGHLVSKAAQEVAIIKCASGGTSLAVDWDPDNASGMYPYCLNFIQTALADAPVTNPQVVGLLWVQGEADSKDQAMADAYLANLQALLGRFRTDLGVADLPFSLYRLHHTRTAFYPLTSVVQTAQDDADAQGPLVVTVNVDDLPMGSDNSHLTAEAQWGLGQRGGQALLDMQGGGLTDSELTRVESLTWGAVGDDLRAVSEGRATSKTCGTQTIGPNAPCVTADGLLIETGDSPTVSTAGWPDGKGCVEVEYAPLASGAPSTVSLLRTATTNEGVYLRLNAGGALQFYGFDTTTNQSFTSSTLSWAAGTTYRVEACWDGDSASVRRDGVVVGSGAIQPVTGHGTAHLGHSSGTAQANGYLRLLGVRGR